MTDSRKIVSPYTEAHTTSNQLRDFLGYCFGKRPYMSELSHVEAPVTLSTKTEETTTSGADPSFLLKVNTLLVGAAEQLLSPGSSQPLG